MARVRYLHCLQSDSSLCRNGCCRDVAKAIRHKQALLPIAKRARSSYGDEAPCSGSTIFTCLWSRVLVQVPVTGQNGVRGDCNVKQHSPTPSFPSTGLLATPRVYK